MVLTRHVPPARLIGKLRVQGELLEVNTDELRLSSAEIEALVARFKEIQLDESGNTTLQLEKGSYMLMRADKFLSLEDLLNDKSQFIMLFYM